MIVYLDGKFVPSETAQLPVLSPGCLYGYGLFETMRAASGRVVARRQHLGRLCSSARLIGLRLPVPRRSLGAVLTETLHRNRLSDAGLRMTLWEGELAAHLLVAAYPYQVLPRRLLRTGIRLWLSPVTNQRAGRFPRLKTLGYLPYLWSYRQAIARGYDEALLLTGQGDLSEASRSNLFFIRNGTLCTPALSCGCLAGITRRITLRLARQIGLPAEEGRYTLEDLTGADEAFLTGSLKGIVPVCAVEKKVCAAGRCGPLTARLMRAYAKAVRERSL